MSALQLGPTAATLLALFSAGAFPLADAAEFSAGGYSFSDELGGFRLLSASGLGTPADPIVLAEEIDEVAAVTLVVRRLAGAEPRVLLTQLTLVKAIANRSERVWAGFEISLQEILGRPSSYEDGLSFNQFAAQPPDVASDSFAENNRSFEPADRIRFQKGHVDPGATAHFKVTITDPTPVAKFYLVQDPQLLSASLPQRPRAYAAQMTTR